MHFSTDLITVYCKIPGQDIQLYRNQVGTKVHHRVPEIPGQDIQYTVIRSVLKCITASQKYLDRIYSMP